MQLATLLPWTDRQGRPVPLKALTFGLLLLPGLLYAWWWWHGDLIGRPLDAVIDGTGDWALRFFILSLVITPLRYLLDAPRIVPLRRMVGVAAMSYALIHLGLYATDQQWNLATVALEIIRRTYLTIGFIVLLGLVVLGATSTDGWIRRLGSRWKRLHRLVFLLVPLGLLHYFIQSKADVSQPVLWSGFFIWLGLWRLLPATRRSWVPALLALAPLAGLLAAALEYVWYASATNIPAIRVLMANLDVSFGPRPAVWVVIIAAAVALASWPARQIVAKLTPAPVKRPRPARAGATTGG